MKGAGHFGGHLKMNSLLWPERRTAPRRLVVDVGIVFLPLVASGAVILLCCSDPLNQKSTARYDARLSSSMDLFCIMTTD